MTAKLVDCVLDREYPLPEKDAVTIGRGNGNDISLPEYHEDDAIAKSLSRVSRHHATIERKDGKYFIKDNSTNGTYINGYPVKFAEIKNGSELKFPFYLVKFVIE
jgi:pSer/pThr/pTyr-binding forkhead associated (FHA) protein